jgi:hypothetical protein
MEDDSKQPQKTASNNWDLYNLLSNTLQQYHSRWVENYKIFLAFNSFLLPAATALLGYSIKENLIHLRYITVLLCIVGTMASYLGYRLLKRINVDINIRFNQLVRLESSMDWLPLKPFTEGKAFFFQGKNLDHYIGDDTFCQERFKDKGIRAIDAYKYISIAISLFYIVIFGYLSLKEDDPEKLANWDVYLGTPKVVHRYLNKAVLRNIPKTNSADLISLRTVYDHLGSKDLPFIEKLGMNVSSAEALPVWSCNLMGAQIWSHTGFSRSYEEFLIWNGQHPVTYFLGKRYGTTSSLDDNRKPGYSPAPADDLAPSPWTDPS